MSSAHLRLHHLHQLIVPFRIALSQLLQLLMYHLLVHTHWTSHSPSHTSISHITLVLLRIPSITFISARSTHSSHTSHLIPHQSSLESTHQRHYHLL